MKKLAMNLLKTADEKLRSIGKQHNQSGTVVQTQNFAFFKHQPSQEDPPLKPLVPIQQQEQQQNQQQLQQRPEGAAVAAAPSRQLAEELAPDIMAERMIARQGRRDRNGYRAADELDRSELKRRSKSEGPNRRVRQSMDEREGGKKQTFDGGGRRLHESSDSSDSDRSPRALGCTGRIESDSDSDPKRWTKNPLVVRRVKRSEKGKHADKRISGTENGIASKNRDSWVYYGNEDASSGSLGGGNSSSKDGGGSGKGSSKYQKLEEMRKKRLNLSVTSDEENTPASRISRLRQRAIQSGLGEQARSSALIQVPPSESVQWDSKPRQRQQIQPPQQQPLGYASPNTGIRKFPVSTADMGQSRPEVPARPGFGSTNPPTAFTPQPFSQPSQNIRPVFPANVRPMSQSFQPVSKVGAPLADLDSRTNQQPQPAFLQQRTTVTQQSPSHRQPPARPPPPNIPGVRPPFHTIPEPHSIQSTRALYNSSPEVTAPAQRPQTGVSYADPALDPASRATRNITQPGHFSQIPRHAPGRGSPAAAASPFVSHSSHASRDSPSQYNEVVELRLKSTREVDRPRSHFKIPKKTVAKISDLGRSDDSLDELIESNIQYLDNELDKTKSKRNSSASVSRSSSLPDPRRLGHVPAASTFQQQPAIQVQASTSIQFHVNVPSDSRQGPSVSQPVIHIAPSNAVDYPTSFSYENQLHSQPDVVPRKGSYDSRAKLSRPTSDYFGRDDLSKSDSQLNAPIVVPSYLGKSLHPDQAYARGCVSDISLRNSPGSTLETPQTDKGMFSDVEYDIEVAERVKKWETKLKIQDMQSKKDNQNLSTIQENNEGESLMLPSEVRKSVLLSKQGDFGAPVSREVAPYTPPTRPRPFSSDTSINRVGDPTAPKMFSLETNAHRFFQVIQDPQTGPRLGLQSQSVSSVFQPSFNIRPEKNFMSANELRQQMLSNRRPVLPITSAPMQAIHPAVPQTVPEAEPPHRPTHLGDLKDAAKRGSRYQDELEELNTVKTDSVVNLRRRFDNDSTTVTSEDDQKAVSTASTKISRPSKQSPTHKDHDSMDLSKMLPGYQNKIKDTDVWSPNLESTQGVPVSIERVTARTLQTIPFSEDPFWKEIEEMTSFDPNSMAGHLSSGNNQEPVKSQHQVELTPPHSSTLPTHPRSNLLPNKERMQRSKSLYTPNITPLTINVNDKASSNAVSALDEVLDDISRSSIERRQISPKKRAVETEVTSSKTTGVSNVPGFIKAKQEPTKPGYKFEGGQFTFMKPGVDSQSQQVKPLESSGIAQLRQEQIPAQPKQPIQFYQQQRLQQHNQPMPQQQQQQQQQLNRQSQILQGGVNNYHLDPDLLKQKLLSTGLVVETDTEEAAGPKQYRSSSLDSNAPTFISYSAAVPTYTPMTAEAKITPRPTDFRAPISTVAPPKQPQPLPVVSTSTTTSGGLSRPVKPSGTSALEDIQRALAPFSSGYEPGPESLYGTARMESFKDNRFDTTRGSNTSATSWSYQPQPKQEETTNVAQIPADNKASRLQQVNESMDDLKDLAQNVEQKINVIKHKLQSADEKSLDTILTSLRKVTPEVKSQDIDPANFEDYYHVKKSKLSDALSELDRIYKSLDFSNDEIVQQRERGKIKPYRPSKSSDFILASQPKSEHLRPMQTRISSIYVPGLETKTKPDLDKETESEFDIISKSFQAIVDEVNQTTDMFSRAAEKNKQENTAPEAQRQTFKITLKPGDVSDPSAPATKPLWNTSHEETAKAPPITAPKPQEMKTKGGRFRSKLQDASTEEDPNVKKVRSKSVPGLDSNTVDLLASAAEGSSNVSQMSTSTTATATATVTTTTATATVSTPPPRHRQRVRPVKDNKIIQEDRAARRDSNEKLYGMPPSPQPSPKVTRKIIYNNGVDLDVKIQPPQMFQDAPEDAAPTEATPSQPQVSVVKQKAPKIEEKQVHRPAEPEFRPDTVASPASQKKIPPPTAAKPSVKSEIAVALPSKGTSSIPVPSKPEPSKGSEQLHLNVSKLIMSDSSSSIASGQGMTSSSASINLTPPVSDSQQSKPLSSPRNETAPETDNTGSGGHKSKRKLGTGVAMMMDKFNTGEDKMKKRLGTRSAPDLSGANRPGDIDEDEVDEKAKVPGKAESKDSTHSSFVKSSVHKFGEKKGLSLQADGSRSPVIRSTVISSLERKVIDPDGKAPSSGTSSPQPSSPSNKPPLHPWKRQPSDPDKPSVSDAIIQESSTPVAVTSPKFVSRIPRPITVSSTVSSSAGASAASTSKGTESPRPGADSPKVATRRLRPANRKLQTTTVSERPHSFHELLSCFEREPSNLQSSDKFRKSASADEVNTHAMTYKMFRSERNLTPLIKSGDKVKKGNEVVFKFDLKRKS